MVSSYCSSLVWPGQLTSSEDENVDLAVTRRKRAHPHKFHRFHEEMVTFRARQRLSGCGSTVTRMRTDVEYVIM